MTSKIRLCTALALAASAFAAPAAVVTLTFEGAGNLAKLDRFYAGGTDSKGHRGTNHGVVFGANALAIIDMDVPAAPGAGLNTGNFGNEPSPDTVLFFLEGRALLDYADGFRDGFSFFYSSTTWTGLVSVYDGLNATGSLLGTIDLLPLGEGSGDPTGSYNRWAPGGLSFAGTARSVVFGGTGDRIAFDNVTFGSATPTLTPVPALPVGEPSSLALLALALLATAVVMRRRA